MLHPAKGIAPIPIKELPKMLREKDVGEEERGYVSRKKEKERKILPYGLEDLTIGSWVSLGRELGEDSGRGRKKREMFVRYMYQGGDLG